MEWDANDIGDLAEEEAKKAGISPELFRKVVLSGEWYGKPKIDTSLVSDKDAQGPAQVIPATWKGLIQNGKIPEDADPSDVRTNLRAGALVLKEQLDAAGGNEKAAVAGYNGGNAARVAVASGKPAPATETQSYLQRVFDDAGAGRGFVNPPNVVADAPDSTSSSLPLSRVSYRGVSPQDQAQQAADLDRILAANKALTVQLQQALTGSAEAYQTGAKAAVQAGDAEAEAYRAKGAIDVATLLQKQAVAGVYHASISDPDSTIVEAEKARRAAQIKMDGLRPTIDAEDQVQVWDDPLRWIANQFTLPTLKKEYNQAARTEAIMTQRMAETRKAVAEQQGIDPAAISTELQTHAAAMASAARFKALQESSKLLGDSAQISAKIIQADMIFNDRSWDERMRLAKLHQESISYARAVDADNKVAAQDKRLQGVVDVLNTKLNSIGMPSIDVPTLKTLGPKRAGDMIDWAQLPTLGNGPGESLAAIRNFGSDQKLFEKDPELYGFFVKLTQTKDFKDAYAVKQQDPKFQHLGQQEQREAVLQDVYQKQLSDLLSNKNDNSKLPKGNPYILQHAAYAPFAKVDNNEFAKELPTLATVAGAEGVKDKDLLLNFLGKVKAEPNAIKQHAAELSEYYRKVADTQWQRSGAMVTGYPRFRGYGVTDPWSPKVINVMNPLELEAWATRRMAADLRPTADMLGLGMMRMPPPY